MQHLYVSYAEKDTSYGNHFKQLLKPAIKARELAAWSLQDVSPGAEWQEEMAAHLREASLFVPLISADHLASDRCQAETDAALRLQQQGGLQIVCVLVRPVDLGLSPLERLPHLPAQNQPLTTWRNQDTAWVQVQRGILEIIERGFSKRGSLPPG